MSLFLAACARPQLQELYPQLSEYEGREISQVRFLNPEPFSTDSLRELTDTHATRCRLLGFLPFCFPGTGWGREVGRLELQTISRDIQRLSLLYRRSGFFGTRIEPDVDPEDRDGPVRLVFRIDRADAVILDSVVVEGTEGILDPDSLEAVIPSQPGDRFDVDVFLASADTVLVGLRRLGHAHAEILRNYSVDTIQDRATAWIVAVPGPRVVIDSLIVVGNEDLGRSTVLRQVPFREGDLLRFSRLREGQRNLYELEMVQFATVALAADSLQVEPADSSTATVVIQLSEAPRHQVEAVAGWGSVECVRTSAQWVDRNFLGGARRLALTGSLSRIGIGGPTRGAVGRTLCPAGSDTFATALDYRVAAELTQPYFVTARSNALLRAFAERQSEPELYQRTAQGARAELSHRLGSREVLSTSLDIERRQTRAVPALYCYAFLVCDPAEIEVFAQTRWRNALGATWVRDRSDQPLDPRHGYNTRTTTLWATPLLGSSYDFLRVAAEGALYREPRHDWVVAGFLRIGTFVTDAGIGLDNFIAPEERFFAGGASSVRGFRRNELGPGIWLYEGTEELGDVDGDTLGALPVRFVPSGGTSVAVSSLELRFPSPVLRDLVRMVAFADAGTVGLEPIWKMESQWRVTPGAGLRVLTPVGPVRVDIAYNPYPPTRGPLFVPDPVTGGLRRAAEGYRPDVGGWERLRLHIGVGHTF